MTARREFAAGRKDQPPAGQHATMRRSTLAILLSSFALVLTWAAGATWFILCRDDLVARVLSRQAEVQYSYEDRIAMLRSQVDRIASRQLVNQDSFEGRVSQLMARQAQIETRQAVLANLGDGAHAAGIVAAALPAERTILPPRRPVAANSAPSLFGDATGGPAEPLPLAKVPALATPAAALPAPRPVDSKPRPELLPEQEAAPVLRGTADRASLLPPEDPAARAVIGGQLDIAETSLKAVETAQIKTLEALTEVARRRTVAMGAVLSDIGLDSGDVKPVPAMGGPFIPLKVDPRRGPFEALVASAQTALMDAWRLRQVVSSLPLSRPLPAASELTSNFGYRLDPFTRSPAMHSGIDFRGETGTPVQAAGAGTVTFAGWNGGYGQMVEIEHANGISTRYAHLSGVDVSEGTRVKAGQVLGRVGSTGRSTAPHLHYETRLDGSAVDPIRFLKAASRLGAIF